MASVTIENIAKRYGDVEVISELSLDIRDREFMVLVGPSGCGKSTLLRMVAGLEEITAGRIAIGDRVVNDLAPKARDIAMVFQNYALYPHMSVRQNLEFGLKMRKTPKDEMRARVDEAARILGITDYLERKPRQLSGGQRQRVAVGRAIVRKPAVFLFDEPLSNLDAKLRAEMRTEITRLQHRLETTTIYVTHDQVEAMTMGHRIAVMHEGNLQQVGTPLELYDTPANLFVAKFIGTPPMNVLSAAVDSGRLSASGFELPLPERFVAQAGSNGPRNVLMGLRPEHVTSGERVRGASAEIRARVDVVEPLGHEVVVHTRVGDESIVAKLEPHHIPEVGSELSLTVALDALHLFDATSETSLAS